GFEVDVTQPLQATTEIWGDGNPANGAAPGVLGDLFAANTVVVVREDIVSATRQAVLDYDGSDRIASTRTIALTRALWADGPETLHAGAVEGYPVNQWGTAYRAPVGVDTVVPAPDLFEYTSLAIMAAAPGTLVQVDGDNNGSFELSATLGQGESYLTPGTIRQGATVSATAPVQVTMITGDICAIYEARWHVLFPVDQWDDAYYSPVSTIPARGTTAYLYNPSVTPLTVTREISGGVMITLTVPAGGTLANDLPDGTGAAFVAPDGRPFAAIAVIDTTSSDRSSADWGFDLIPEKRLTAQTLIGWGAGRDPDSPVNPTENSSPVWVMPVLANGGPPTVRLCADYNGDGVGPLTDANGFQYDQHFILPEFANAKIRDADGDQTGMLVYVCDPNPAQPSGARLAAAWGQDPDGASEDSPALDLGTSAPPAASFEAGKSAELIDDRDGDGRVDGGDALRYTILVRNASRVALPNVFISDTVPVHTAYILSSTVVITTGAPLTLADNLTGTPFPLDEGGIDLGPLPIAGVFTVTFDVRLDDPLPEEVDRVRNVAVVRVGDETDEPEVETPVDQEPAIDLNKVASAASVLVGSPVTYTLTVSNPGALPLQSVTLVDNRCSVSLVGGDLNGNNILDLAETWTYTCAVVITQTVVNTATVTAQTASGVPVTDTATALVTAIPLAPAIALVKTVNDTAVPVSTTVTYTLILTNAGNQPLHDVTLVDNRCTLTFTGGDANSNNLLDLTESWGYTCSEFITQTTVNTATVTALSPLGVPVSDTASVRVTAFVPILYLPIIRATPPQQPPTPCPPPIGCDLTSEIKALAVHEGTNRLYVVARNPDRLLLVNPDTVAILDEAAAGPQPWGIVVNEQTNRVYVSNFAGGEVWVYDANTLDILQRIAVGGNPSLMEVLPDLDMVFVLVRANSRLVVIQGLTIAQDISTQGSGPFGIAADPINQRIYISHRDSASMSVVRRENNQWQAFAGPRFDDQRQLFELEYSANTQRLYLVWADAQSNWYLDVWEPQLNSLWGRFSTQPLPSGGSIFSSQVGGTGLEANPATNHVFNVNTGANSLSVLNGFTNGVLATVPLGTDPFAVAVNGDTNTVFVGLRSSGNLVKLTDNY
ncbi:MAG TPA: hypothetical protein VNK95_16575, partial [Caldilineaceae bacterium]|nr:hypothetical protein [Caldilineaceae bacterium]